MDTRQADLFSLTSLIVHQNVHQNVYWKVCCLLESLFTGKFVAQQTWENFSFERQKLMAGGKNAHNYSIQNSTFCLSQYLKSCKGNQLYNQCRSQHGHYYIFRRWCKLDFGLQHGSGELECKIYKEVYFSSCLVFFSTTTSHRLKKKNFPCQNLTYPKLLFLV